MLSLHRLNTNFCMSVGPQEAAEEAAAKAKAAEEERKAVLADLAKSVGEPRDLFKKAVDLIIKYTSAGAAYAAAVAEPEEPDWQYPEDPEDPAAVESEDEADPVPVVPGEGEGEEAPAEPAPAEGEGGEEAAEGEEAAPKIPKPIDYSKKYLSYMVGSQGQEFMATTELHRPPPPPEDDPEAPTEPVPFTFRILDEKRPMVYLPNVAFEPSVRFFRNFPKVGSRVRNASAKRNQKGASMGRGKGVLAPEQCHLACMQLACGWGRWFAKRSRRLWPSTLASCKCSAAPTTAGRVIPGVRDTGTWHGRVQGSHCSRHAVP